MFPNPQVALRCRSAALIAGLMLSSAVLERGFLNIAKGW